MLWGHRMRDRADLHLDRSVDFTLDYGKMLFLHCLFHRGDEFLHLLAAAFDIDAAVDGLEDNISARRAQIEFCCHGNSCFK